MQASCQILRNSEMALPRRALLAQLICRRVGSRRLRFGCCVMQAMVLKAIRYI
jgi:hypothetical protein